MQKRESFCVTEKRFTYFPKSHKGCFDPIKYEVEIIFNDQNHFNSPYSAICLINKNCYPKYIIGDCKRLYFYIGCFKQFMANFNSW